MKKLACILIAFMMVMMQFTVFAENDISIKINGENLETPISPVIVNSRTMVPLRAIFESINMNVEWFEATQQIKATNENTTVVLAIGQNIMMVNGELKTIDTAPFISEGHTLIPVRAVAEAIGCEVGWDNENRIVLIETADNKNPETQEPVTQEPEVQEPEVQEPETQEPENKPTGNIPVIDDAPAYINKNDPEIATNAIKYINEIRLEYGLEELVIDEKISNVALGHSMDMADGNYISHTSPSGTTPFDRLDMAGIYYVSACEILGSGFNNHKDVVDSWINSPSHKLSILSSEFTHVGLGYYLGGINGTYWTLVLASR